MEASEHSVAASGLDLLYAVGVRKKTAQILDITGQKLAGCISIDSLKATTFDSNRCSEMEMNVATFRSSK